MADYPYISVEEADRYRGYGKMAAMKHNRTGGPKKTGVKKLLKKRKKKDFSVAQSAADIAAASRTRARDPSNTMNFLRSAGVVD